MFYSKLILLIALFGSTESEASYSPIYTCPGPYACIISSYLGLQFPDGTHQTTAASSGGSGTVTSVAFSVPSTSIFGVSGSPVTTSGTLGMTTTGTSGGIPYFSSTSALSSSAALTASQLVLGGGAGAAPASLAAGSQYQPLVMGASAPGYGALNLAQSAAVTGVLPNANTTATNANTASAIVARDGSGNFSAGTITAALTGHASSDVATSSLGTVTEATSSVLTLTGWTTATVGSPTIQVKQASGSQAGYLSSADWTTFNGKGAGSVTSVAASVPAFLSISGSPVTTSGTLAIGLSGTALPVANGGTALTAIPTSPAASTYSAWDSSSNLSANSHIDAYATTAVSSSTVTLTVTSPRIQYFTGSTANQTVILPVTSTMVAGQSFRIVNLSTKKLTIQSSGANNIVIMNNPSGTAPSSDITFTVINTGVTTAAGWSYPVQAVYIDTNQNFISGPGAAGTVTGTANMFIGNGVGATVTNATGTTFIGNNAAGSWTGGGTNNTAIGSSAMGATTGASLDTCVGVNCLQNDTGSQNIGIGVSTGFFKTTGNQNTLVGYQAGKGTNGTSVYSNSTFIGWDAGLIASTGTDNTFIGNNSGHSVTTGSQNALVGGSSNASAGVTGGCSLGYNTSVTANNAVAIGSGVAAGTANQIVLGTNSMNVYAPNAITVGDTTGTTVTTVSCSSSGTVAFSQPFQGGNYAKVMAYAAACLGTASYTYPTAMVNTPAVITTNGPASSVVTSVSNTAVTITGATTTGFVILEGN